MENGQALPEAGDANYQHAAVNLRSAIEAWTLMIWVLIGIKSTSMMATFRCRDLYKVSSRSRAITYFHEVIQMKIMNEWTYFSVEFSFGTIFAYQESRRVFGFHSRLGKLSYLQFMCVSNGWCYVNLVWWVWDMLIIKLDSDSVFTYNERKVRLTWLYQCNAMQCNFKIYNTTIVMNTLIFLFCPSSDKDK